VLYWALPLPWEPLLVCMRKLGILLGRVVGRANLVSMQWVELAQAFSWKPSYIEFIEFIFIADGSTYLARTPIRLNVFDCCAMSKSQSNQHRKPCTFGSKCQSNVTSWQ